MMRLPLTVLTGLLVASLAGCLDRGGLEPTDAQISVDTGTGSGGRGASGGATGSGGTIGSGGAHSSGGQTGSGGRSATGGAVGTGGAIPTGGNHGTGGVHGTGGASATGGAGGRAMCGPVCDIYCVYGNVADASGCPTCSCKPAPMCTPTGACLVACPNGYATDSNGCATCTCNPVPPACTSTSCGPMPAIPYSVVCSAAGDGGTTATSTSAAPASEAAGITAPIIPATPACQPNSAGNCVWQVNGCRICPSVTCTNVCAGGVKTAPDGCPSCACAS